MTYFEENEKVEILVVEGARGKRYYVDPGQQKRILKNLMRPKTGWHLWVKVYWITGKAVELTPEQALELLPEDNDG